MKKLIVIFFLGCLAMRCFSQVTDTAVLEIINPDGTEDLKVKEGLNLEWRINNNSEGKLKLLRIEYSTGSMDSWNILFDRIDAALLQKKFKILNIGSVPFKIKISDSENLNIFRISNLLKADTSKKAEEKKSKLTLLNPVTTDTLHAKQKVNIFWKFEDVNDTDFVNIKFSKDFFGDSSSYILLGKVKVSLQKFDWIVPDSADTKLGKIKILLASDQKISDENKKPFIINSPSLSEKDKFGLKFYLGATFDMLEKKLDANSAFGDLYVDLPNVIHVFNKQVKITFSASSGKSSVSEPTDNFLSPDKTTTIERSVTKLVKFLNFSGKYYFRMYDNFVYFNKSFKGKSEIYFVISTDFRKVMTDASVNVKTTVRDSNSTVISEKTSEITNRINDDYFSLGPGFGFFFSSPVLDLSLKTIINKYLGSNENTVLNYLTQFKLNFADPDILIGLELRGPLYTTNSRRIDSEVLFFVSKGINLVEIFKGLF